MDTPKRNVHFASGVAAFSPASDTSSEMFDSSSSLQYINAQLVAHGFAPSPGISLDGISSSDSERVVKCLLSLLGQRVEDMSRTEELSTKLRTLSYDHERLRTMHGSVKDQLANAEREMTLQKNRFNGLTRTLQNTENTHKQTVAELQRTRSALQAVRTAHQAESKRRDKDMDRMTERWSKIADAQAKISATRSGIRCANLSVVEGAQTRIADDSNVLEAALKDSERICGKLREDNGRLRGLVAVAANELQSIVHDTKYLLHKTDEHPMPLSETVLFPLNPPTFARDKIQDLASTQKNLLWQLPAPSDQTSSKPTPSKAQERETIRLQSVVKTLQTQLDESHQKLARQAEEVQALMDELAQEQRQLSSEINEKSLELANSAADDEERARLEEMKVHLEAERSKFTEATIQLGKDKLALEAARTNFREEKQNWESEKMLAEYLPPSPQATEPSPSPEPQLKKSTKRSGRSPLQVSVGKANSPRKRAKRPAGIKPSSKVEAPYETEYMPPPLPSANSFGLKPLGTSLLPSSFSLPPPSPHIAQIPAASPESDTDSPPSPDANAGPSKVTPQSPSVPIHSTPGRAFPMAKTKNPRMIHAYSPARPSPLSRILMLGNSPENGGNPLEALLEEESELDAGGIDQVFPEVKPSNGGRLSLAQELGVSEETSESEQDSPCRDKKHPSSRGAAASKPKPPLKTGGHTQGSSNPASKMVKGKGKTLSSHATGKSSALAGEKENTAAKKKNSTSAQPASSSRPAAAGATKKPYASGTSSSRARLMGKLPTAATKGPQRIPVNSADAPMNARKS